MAREWTVSGEDQRSPEQIEKDADKAKKEDERAK